ncbi:hypothetical protein SAMN05444392_106113 [Seinonella peptonophila]|uniref:Uncharacterized protein n=1 Tax=Seinonella peptonophila TaxID=112248 RepID=A0A1M4Y9P7_9BACL|nr:hypothetical protein [Seinonella peptonophila]SHF02222.1 hypothetical protein SAMN05444392_106113 [Seinonella peptonophila]
MEEYVSLEIEIQHYWHYINCIEKTLPKHITDLKNTALTMEDIIKLKFEANIIEEDIQFINDSSLPDRFRLVLKGLLETSQILNELKRYKNKLDYWKEILTNKQQIKQRIWTPTIEILLYTVAYLQIAPTLYKFFIDPTIQSIGAFVGVIVLFALGALLIYLKNYNSK